MSEAAEAALPAVPPEPLPWRRGVAWLLFLGPFFFISYGIANASAAHRAIGRAIVFDWERSIPFVPWTIVPYWSIDLIYGLSFLLCRTGREVDVHARRLLTAQFVSIGCFLAFPLRFSFDRPASEGLFGAMFDALTSFDQPFNQAPSLHIVLLVVLWVRYAEASRGLWRLATHAWALLIGVSVLTTYQHHFIDVPTGALVGLVCVWMWPDHGSSPLRAWRLSRCPDRRRLGGYYLLAALICAALASRGGWALWLLWPAAALALMGLIYLGLGAEGFQKHDGRLSVAAAWLLAPYRIGAWINSRLWTRRLPSCVEIGDGVWLGRLPTQYEVERRGFGGLVDLAAEFSAPQGAWNGISLNWLDLVPPQSRDLALAAEQIERLRARGPVLVYCALGYSRSAAAVAAWLLRTGRAVDVEAAVELIAARRPLALGTAHWAALRNMPSAA